jgi:hypothetical protein
MGQVLHGSATTTEAVRRAIQHSQESLRSLAKRYGVNPKTIAKWRVRTSVSDLPTGPRAPRSTGGRLPALPDRRRPLQGPHGPHQQRDPLHHAMALDASIGRKATVGGMAGTAYRVASEGLVPPSGFAIVLNTM